MDTPLIAVEHLNKRYGSTVAVEDLSFQIMRGGILGLLGESGCGKTTLARMILGLERPDCGVITYNGREIQGLSQRDFRPLRKKMQMVLQNPFDSLDPERRIGSLLEEPLKIWHGGINRYKRHDAIKTMLEECGLPLDCLRKKPSEFSGGQLQRLSIARALLSQPEFLVADEIVSALDVPIQAQVLDLLLKLRDTHSLTILFISHDLSVIRKVADRVMVMQEGKIVCCGDTVEVLRPGYNPYVDELFGSVFTF